MVSLVGLDPIANPLNRLGSVMDNLESLKSIASSRLRTEDASQQQRAPAVDVSSPPDMPYLRCMRSKPKLNSFTTGVSNSQPTGSSLLSIVPV